MLVFFWILGAMGVAYWAKLAGRMTLLWFIVSLVISPLGGSIALMAADRIGLRF